MQQSKSSISAIAGETYDIQPQAYENKQMNTLDELASIDDEQDAFEFENNESFGLDWDSSPLSFPDDTRRPSSFLQKSVERSSIFLSSKRSDKSNRLSITSPRIIVDSIPFRDRFSNAALVSKRSSTDTNLESSFTSREEEFVPRQLFSSGTSEKVAAVSSPAGKKYNKYLSVGEQSVFSDITESGFSGNAPSSSPLIDSNRKTRVSKNVNDNVKDETSPREELFKVRERTGVDEYEADNKNNTSTRLATFFASRSLTKPKRVLLNSEAACEEKDCGMLIHETKRPTQSSTPPGSASGSSSGYVRWPGTLDKNGCTVFENSSLSTAEDFSNMKDSTTVSNHSSDSVAKVWLQQNHQDETVADGSHEEAPSRSETPSYANQTKQPFTAIARARVTDLKRRFEQRHATKGDKDANASETTSRLKSQINKAKPSNFHVGGALQRSTASSKVNDQRLNRSHDLIIPEDKSVELEHYDLNQTFPGAYRLADESAPKINTKPSLRRMELAGKSVINMYKNRSYESESSTTPVRLSEAALRENDLLTSSFQTVAHGANVKGFRGFINKTADIPNLMDDVESITSASTTAAFRRQEYGDAESDVFDGVGSVGCGATSSQRERTKFNGLMDTNDNSQTIHVLKLKSGISSVQTSPERFDTRMSSADFDAGLSESDTDHATRPYNGKENSNPILPGHYDDISYRDFDGDDESVSWFSDDVIRNDSKTTPTCDLSNFAVSSSQVRKLVKAYRRMSQFMSSGIISQHEEDSKKAFALFEMRSRIMQTDIERGFERTGGTVTVDDSVLTRYFKACCRVRDAVIVSKAWRDGATPQDARTALNLTEGRDFYVKRTSNVVHPSPNLSFDHQSIGSSSSHIIVTYERIGWIDDTDFCLIKCFGAKILRGSGIFTVGDCQSMLLKLTHEHLEVSELRYFMFYLCIAVIGADTHKSGIFRT